MSSTSRTRPRLGLFLRGDDYKYQSDIVRGAHEECQQHSFDLLCFAGGLIDEADPHNAIYQLCEDSALDGGIVVGSTMGVGSQSAGLSGLVQKIAQGRLVSIGVPLAGIPTLCVDNAGSVQDLTRHLIESHGRRRIAFIAGRGNESDQRREGYLAALRACGLRVHPERVLRGNYTPESGARAVNRLFGSGGVGCDAIIAANDWMAIGAIEALTARGHRVPDDLSVAGFDDIEEGRYFSPSLTTIRQQPSHLGARAVRWMVDLLDGRHGTAAPQVQATLLLRQSCGCFARSQPEHRAEDSPQKVTDVEALLAHRRRWLRAIWASAPPADQLVNDSFAEQLADSLLRDMKHLVDRDFLTTVDRIVREPLHLGHATAWHRTLSHLRSVVVPLLAASPKLWLHAESLFEQAHLIVGGIAEQDQARRRMASETTQRNLSALGAELRTALDYGALQATLGAYLPSLKIPSLLLCEPTTRTESGQRLLTKDSHVTAVVHYQQPRGLILNDGSSEFSALRLFPPEAETTERTSWIARTLVFGGQPFGYSLAELTSNNFSACLTISELLSTSLQGMALAQAAVGEARRREQLEQQRLAQELRLATRIQTGVLPTQFAIPGLDISAQMIPAKEVGGDYFDVLRCDDGCWLGIGDVAGHGVHSGMVTLMLQSGMMTATKLLPSASPKLAWLALNATLVENIRVRLRQDEHATLTVFRYSSDGRLKWAGAHEEFLWYRARERRCESVATPGLWAGITARPAMESVVEQDLQLCPNDLLILYTDGLVHARNADGEAFGIERLSALVESHAEDAVHDLTARIMGEVGHWMQDQKDDMTLVVVRHLGAKDS